MKQFNGSKLKSARLYRGMTAEELAGKIGVSKQTISQYENKNDVTPTFEKMTALSRALSFPYNYFLQPNSVQISSGSTYFRSLLKTNKKYRTEQIVKMEHLATIYSVLKEYLEFPAVNLPKDLDLLSPEEAAKKLREYWGIGNAPVGDMIRLLEENGIIVTMFHTPTDDIDAFSQLVDIDQEDIYLVALSKNKDTAARTHFDVAHELGHIVLHGWGEDVEALGRDRFKEIEREANRFAASFLLPEETFSRDVSAFSSTLDYYIQLKRKWKVSVAAMLYRSCDLGLINQSQYQYMIRIMHKKGWHKEEPYDKILVTAKPSLLKDAVDVLQTNDIFTATEFLEELSDRGIAMNYQDIELLLDLDKDTLKPSKSSNFGKIVTLKPNPDNK